MKEKSLKSSKTPAAVTSDRAIPTTEGSSEKAPYEKPRVRIYAPLHELTFLTAMGATGVGVVTSVSGGGH